MTATRDTIPNTIAALDALLLEQLELGAELERKVAAFDARLESVTGAKYERSGIKVHTPSHRSLLSDYFDRVERIAVELLSGPLAPYEVPCNLRPAAPDYCDFYEADDERMQAVRTPCMPSAYYRKLADRQDLTAQRAAAARHTAAVLGRLVGLLYPGHEIRRNPRFKPPVEVRGCVELAFPGIYIRDYGTPRPIVGRNAFDAADALQYALNHVGAEPHDLAASMHSALHAHERSDFVSRTRLHFAGGAYMVAFRSGYRLYLPRPIAEAVNLFVSEQLADVLAAPVEAA